MKEQIAFPRRFCLSNFSIVSFLNTENLSLAKLNLRFAFRMPSSAALSDISSNSTRRSTKRNIETSFQTFSTCFVFAVKQQQKQHHRHLNWRERWRGFFFSHREKNLDFISMTHNLCDRRRIQFSRVIVDVCDTSQLTVELSSQFKSA